MDIRFSFAENISYLSHVTTAKFRRGDSIPCFICIISFSRFKNALAKINMSELGPRHKKLSCWYKKKIWFLWIRGSRIKIWKPWGWRKFDLILLMNDMYLNSTLEPLLKFWSSGKSIWLFRFPNYFDSPIEHPQMITRIIPVSSRIIKKNVRWKGAYSCESKSTSTERRQEHCQNFSMKRRLLQNKY